MIRRFAQRPLAQMERPYRSWTSCMLLLALIFAVPSFSTAAAGHDPPSRISEQTGTLPRPAVVKSNANLRASPWLEGKILAVAKEGMIVQVLEETDRWYQVKTEKRTEAWIHKTLVVLLNRPPSLQPEELSAALVSEQSERSLQSKQLSERSGRSRQPAPMPPPEPSKEAPRSPAVEQPAPSAPLPDDRTWADFQNLGVYLAAVLFVGLLAVIGLQLRSARQLRRAMREMDQITHHPVPARQQTVDVSTLPRPLNVVEETHTEGTPAPTDVSQAATTPIHPNADIARLPDLPVELSPLERAVLEAIHEHREVQEGDLRKALENRGFPGVLIKAVISDVVRKTGSEGPPWISVRYAHGRYTYRLQLRNMQRDTSERQRLNNTNER